MVVELLVTLVIPLGLDLFMPVPEENPLTAERIELGRQLFFDRRLRRRKGAAGCLPSNALGRDAVRRETVRRAVPSR
jgi:hypothetical protein